MAGEYKERVVNKLRDRMATASILLPQKEGDVGGIIEAVGGTLGASHSDSDRIRTYFGRRFLVGGAEEVQKKAI